MLKEIKEIGETYRKSIGENFVQTLVIREREGENNDNLMLVINFDLEKKETDFLPIEIDDKRLEEYLWVGNCKGTNPQDRLTSNSVSYLFFESPKNLYKGLKEGELKNKLKAILDEFFVTDKLGEEEITYLNPSKLNPLKKWKEEIDNEIAKIRETASKETEKKKKIKKFKNSYEKLLLNFIERANVIKGKDISLYSFTIDGKKPSEIKEYIEYLEQKIIEESFENSIEGECFVCGKRDELTSDTTQIPAKFYITNLVIFSSELEGKPSKKGQIAGFAKNFSICKDCFKDIISGISYMKNYLNVYLADNTAWIIPGLFFNPISERLTLNWIKFSQILTKSIFTLDDFIEYKDKIEKGMEDYIKYENIADYSYVDILFYNQPPGRAEFKIRKYIREIPLPRVKHLTKIMSEVQEIGNELLGKDKNWFISLDKIYRLVPVRKGESQEYKKILDLYEDILLGYKLDKEFLINSFLTLAKIYIYERTDYNVKPRNNNDFNLTRDILATNLLIKLLEKLNLIEGGEFMNSLHEVLDKDMANYIEKMGFTNEETALFLLGYLIGEIGAEQIRGADYNAKKPILNKINFNGMSPKNLLNLANDVFDKLDQYRIRGYNEKIYAVMKSLLDAHIKNWSLSDTENVYYILSGYSYSTYKRITSVRGKEEN